MVSKSNVNKNTINSSSKSHNWNTLEKNLIKILWKFLTWEEDNEIERKISQDGKLLDETSGL